MATSVTTAFHEFLANEVNLDPDDTRGARSSLEWLLGQIAAFPGRHSDFPLLHPDSGMHIAFGSFARGTKIRPLDDVDVMMCLHATGATYEVISHDNVRLKVPEGSRLRAYCHDDGEHLNSRRVINAFVRALEDVPQYGKADINRRSEAATLRLISYDWNFDIVPAFITNPDLFQKTYYLIPNGSGEWKKTDPRIDRDRVIRINAGHKGNMLDVLRAVKYWQRRATMPTMPSYLLECIVVNHFERQLFAPVSAYVDLSLAAVFRSLAVDVLGVVPDPKGIAQDLNSLGWEQRFSIRERALQDANRVDEARRLETQKDHRGSIAMWRQIFGENFPAYG